MTLVGRSGNWNGTPTIDYSYQWQRCTSAQPSTCHDISGATNKDYTLTSADELGFVRLAVTASNDFPTFSKDLAYSAVQGPVQHQIGPLPRANQQSGPTIEVTPARDQFLPTERDTLSAPAQSGAWLSGWLLNPAASTVINQWLRCDENGETTLPLSAPTNQIIPLPANDLTPPTLDGNADVGSSLVGGVGSWANPATWWTRQWEQCQPDGSECTPIPGATGPEYTVRPDDLGMTIRMHLSADVNASYQLPDAVDAYTPLSAVVTEPPGTPPPTGPGGPTPAGSNPSPPPSGPKTSPQPPQAVAGAPSLTHVSLGHHGRQAQVSFRLSGRGSVTLTLVAQRPGHLAHHRCVAGRRRHARACKSNQVVARINRGNLTGGLVTVPRPTTIHGRRLRHGRYLLVLTPSSPGGRPAQAITLRLKLV